jgi:hypothetical protein
MVEYKKQCPYQTKQLAQVRQKSYLVDNDSLKDTSRPYDTVSKRISEETNPSHDKSNRQKYCLLAAVVRSR